MKMLDAGREHREAKRAEIRADESGKPDADVDPLPDGGRTEPDLPAAVSSRLAPGVLAALPAGVANDVPDDTMESEIDEAVRLLRRIAEQQMDGKPTA